MGVWFCREVFGFCCEVFGFAMRSLVLRWGFWFCREVFCFCCEVFVFTLRFSVLPWGSLFLPWGFGFAMTVVGHRSLHILTRNVLSRTVSSLNDHYFNHAILVFVHFSESSLYICQKCRSVRNWDFKKFYGYKKISFQTKKRNILKHFIRHMKTLLSI